MHVSDKFLAYFEHRLTRPERLKVEAHLRECAVCRAELNTARQAHEALTDTGWMLTRLPAPQTRWPQVQQRWRRALPRPAWVRARLAPWQVSISMMLVTLLFVSSFALNTAKAAFPNVPAVQTPAANLSVENITSPATKPIMHISHTPTLTSLPLPATTRP